ncbi:MULTISPECIES: hypothetical protein [Lysobacter]|uniref:Uncharacterized protein n=1 Tax=Lysobacter firmicutimachus TaxID=1792846 RepID=A0ABU8D1Z1_9GAMM|nr:hypothetical protein [Lysobacter antibioticus]
MNKPAIALGVVPLGGDGLYCADAEIVVIAGVAMAAQALTLIVVTAGNSLD